MVLIILGFYAALNVIVFDMFRIYKHTKIDSFIYTAGAMAMCYAPAIWLYNSMGLDLLADFAVFQTTAFGTIGYYLLTILLLTVAVFLRIIFQYWFEGGQAHDIHKGWYLTASVVTNLMGAFATIMLFIAIYGTANLMPETPLYGG